ncbi:MULTISPECIES: ABC1 kinase family protein [Gordonibacter]|uniref:AarF/ABC1/UbiB kinase family protein n=1 Tax=Gordonibacter urolithinfaciens TaxID=1335613 RepID=A0A1Y4FT52_9ACTN|nr:MULTISPECIES: AarF/UbiB family protein [Gordonibacter]MBS6975569.1 AarF/ABC1/UbiB kinase family protein [Eggerthellaceae bacterium]MDN4469941.1 AarF/ABC1/UbiB kinase family protein [Gordonibacter sp. RACS_AR68]MSA93925.1 AarF/ABC1/UbiB kinase family protein [Gordonibacter urolithinfaciens]MVM54153.1 AarF/ABC1/UbiB kinase family protein [Gordonibacter urolithinfaciens]MVN14409.1 AarF/ABC1/UbiB kinase family protein [Gordonibacter urolithinfaciens]
MADNTLLKYFFSSGAEIDPEGRFNLSRKTRTRRLKEIYSILQKHHFLRGFSPEEFRAMLEDLGPSFVKIGQTLSTRSEILPKAYCDELAKLQMECDPLPFDQMLEALDDIYGERQGDIFDAIDPTPLGSASLAQVHKARLANGDVVAVKIQRPGVKATMALDIDIMRMVARQASRFMKDDQMLDLRDVVEELWATFLEETDFQREAANLQEFARLNKDVAFIDSPHVYPELCGEYVLVMEYIDGIPILATDRLRAAGYDLEEIGEKILDNYATQILDHGFFHADPHPGNLLIRNGKVVYIDLGIMGRLSPHDRAGFGNIIQAVGMQSATELKTALMSFAIAKDNAAIDHTRFLADLDLLLEDYGSCDVADIDIGMFLNDILMLTRSCKVTLPSSITSVSRGLVTLEGTILPFIPNENVVSIINAHIQRTKDPAEELAGAMEDLALALRSSARGSMDAAQYSGEALKMLTRGQLKVNTEVLGSEAPLSHLGKIVNRLTIGIIIAGLFIGSSMLSLSSMEPRLLGVPVLAFFGYLGAAILSLWVVVDIARKK